MVNDRYLRFFSNLTNALIRGVLLKFAGVAIGAGWQTSVAFINVACYYLLGLPLGAVLGFKFKLNELVRHQADDSMFLLLLFIIIRMTSCGPLE